MAAAAIRYLLNVTFNGENDMYLFTPKDPGQRLFSKVEIRDIMDKVNDLCSEEDNDFPFSYSEDEGLEYFMDAFAEYTGGKLELVQEELFMADAGSIAYCRLNLDI